MCGAGPVTSCLRWVEEAKEQIEKENEKKNPGQLIDLDGMSQRWTAFDGLQPPEQGASFPGLWWSLASILKIPARGFVWFFCFVLYAAYVQSIWLAQSSEGCR